MLLLGGILVLATWLVALALVIAIGLPVLRADRRGSVAMLATAAWWGVAIVALLATVLHFFLPLGSPVVIAVVLVTGLALGTVGWRMQIVHVTRPHWTRQTVAFTIATALAFAFLAVVVLGPVTHYDAGLYQWAAVRYAIDFPAIPGLANLYGPLGYSSVQPLLGAMLSSGPWSHDGFRLVNGFFLLLLGWEAWTRMIVRPRGAGTLVAVGGVLLVFPPMLWMADFWVASPTPDVPVVVLALVSAAYVADLAVRESPRSRNTLATLIVLATLMGALRPTALPLALLIVITAVFLHIRSRQPIAVPAMGSAAVIALATAVAVVLRDRTLSGWLGYPLSLFPLDVPWRAPNPEGLRLATVGFARDPGNWQAATEGWTWVGTWFGRLPEQWEPWWLLAALGAGITALALSRPRTTRWRALVAACAPFAVSTLIWWTWAPPAFRFGWGPLFGLTALILGWGAWRARLGPALAMAAALALLATTLAGALFKVDWEAERDGGGLVTVVPLPEPLTDALSLESGVVLRVPKSGDQCWAVYPLCTPQPARTLRLIGESIDSGFVS